MTTPDMKPLLPCPFCGNIKPLVRSTDHGIIIECFGHNPDFVKGCPVNPTTAEWNSFEGAAAAWNTRPTPGNSEAVREALIELTSVMKSTFYDDFSCQEPENIKAVRDAYDKALKSLSAERPE